MDVHEMLCQRADQAGRRYHAATTRLYAQVVRLRMRGELPEVLGRALDAVEQAQEEWDAATERVLAHHRGEVVQFEAAQ